MAHMLYKPHVIGPEGLVTTPDLLLDSISVNGMQTTFALPVHRLLTLHSLQLVTAAHFLLPGYALVACGGGTIMAPVILIYCPEGPVELAEVVMGRFAVRCRALDRHATLRVECSLTSADWADQPTKSQVTLPSDYSADFDRPNDVTLGRSSAEIWPSSHKPLTVEGDTLVETTLRWSDEPHDAVSLSTAIELLPVTAQDRGAGRYSVGPIGPVKHYI